MIGTRLEKILAEKYGKIACGPCRRRVAKLNDMEPDQVLESIDQIADQIFSARNNIKSRLLRMMADTMPHEMVKHVIKNHIRQAVKEERDG